jgi:hypothetical protein
LYEQLMQISQRVSCTYIRGTLLQTNDESGAHGRTKPKQGTCDSRLGAMSLACVRGEAEFADNQLGARPARLLIVYGYMMAGGARLPAGTRSIWEGRSGLSGGNASRTVGIEWRRREDSGGRRRSSPAAAAYCVGGR